MLEVTCFLLQKWHSFYPLEEDMKLPLHYMYNMETFQHVALLLGASPDRVRATYFNKSRYQLLTRKGGHYYMYNDSLYCCSAGGEGRQYSIRYTIPKIHALLAIGGRYAQRVEE